MCICAFKELQWPSRVTLLAQVSDAMFVFWGEIEVVILVKVHFHSGVISSCVKVREGFSQCAEIISHI